MIDMIYLFHTIIGLASSTLQQPGFDVSLPSSRREWTVVLEGL
jgi:hypothetical protein